MGRIRTYAVIPARDEERHIARVITDVVPFVDGICVVDDGSKDSTAELARETLRVHGDLGIGVVISERGVGPGAAVRRGIEHLGTLGISDNDCCVIIDGDGQIPSRLIPQAVDILVHRTENSVLVKGMRTQDHHPHMPRMRRLLGRCSAFAASLAMGVRINDAHCGFAAARLSTMVRLACECPWDGYGYPAHWLLKQVQIGAPIVTVAVPTYYGDETSAMRIRRLVLPLFREYMMGILQRAVRACFRTRRTANLSRSGESITS